MPDESPDQFVVRILGPGGRPAGVGVLVGPAEVMTCAHVVNVALGLDERGQDQPTEAVSLDFPLLPGASPARGTARVVRWFPPPREGAAGDDLAGLMLDGPLPETARPAQLVTNPPPPGRTVRVFGYPGTPPRPDGSWVPTTVRGRVGSGRLQLDSTDAALRVQPGFSGSPVYDDTASRVVGLLVSAAPGRTAERDSYAIGSDRMRLAWPEVLASSPQRKRRRAGASAQAGAPAAGARELTILHVSDPQFGRHHLFGGNGLTPADRAEDTLFRRLHVDLSMVASQYGIHPDLLVVTGDLAEWGLRSEFGQVTEFLGALTEAVEIPRRNVAIVPGNHDVNRKACAAYFAEQESDERDPVAPYWPKWRQFATAFTDFYDGTALTFTPDEPWTLFEMPDLGVVVAGLNSTMAESHRDDDHYGWVGEHQLRWFADRLADYQARGWLRLAAVHHNVVRGAVLDEENLRDAGDLDRQLGQPGLVNLLLHGHTHDGQLHRLPSGLVALSTGSAAVDAAARPAEIPNQYQLITVRRDRFTRYARQYAPGQRRWIGDTRISATGSDWRDEQACRLDRVDMALPPSAIPADRGGGPRPQPRATARSGGGSGSAPDRLATPGTEFLDRVAGATRANFPAATVTLRPESGYLRVSNPLPGGGAEQWPVGAVAGPLTSESLDVFLQQVHDQFASADPSVRSEFVYGGPPAPTPLALKARKRGVRLRNFVEYQGLLDLRPLVDRQNAKLADDRVYPADLYVPQRYRIVDGPDGDTRTGLVGQTVDWLSAGAARLVLVLGDFGRGKTSFLRQLARTLPSELPAVLPVLVELRSLEKAPTLDELLAQHLVRQGVEDINPAKLRYMIHSGRLALLFDGFDELELRVGYDNAADYLQTLLESVSDRAKVVLTSRTQHFQSAQQLRTALGERVATLTASRVAVLEDFSEDQILEFLANLYGGDQDRARRRFELLGDIEDLLGLARNPRMLTFIIALDEDRLRAVQREEGRISAAELYREILHSWLAEEAGRHRHRRGLPSLDEQERLKACTALALRLWASTSPTMGLADLSAEVTTTLNRLAERGYSSAQASHSIGSGSLLTRTDDGAFTFVHQSIMEWLVADAAARSLGDPSGAQVLTTRRMSRLMMDFFRDLAGADAASQWLNRVLADPESSGPAKQNALEMAKRMPVEIITEEAPERQNLAGVDLRDQDLTGLDFRGANLRGANLRGMRLVGTDLSGADLRDADLTAARLVGGSLRGAILTGSQWKRATLLGTDAPDELASTAELQDAAVAGRDHANVMIWLPEDQLAGAAFSPDGSLIAVGSGHGAQLIDVASGRPIRSMSGHASTVQRVTFSPDGTLLAASTYGSTMLIWDLATGDMRTLDNGVSTESHQSTVQSVAFSPDSTLLATAADQTARIWDLADGTTRTTLRGHSDSVEGVAFSPDGTLLATASADQTARIWDLADGTTRTTLRGHSVSVEGVAFSPDGTLLATASADKTARIWDVATGTTRTILEGHSDWLRAVAFSPDGTLLATASDDQTARIWDLASGATRTILDGYTDWVRAVAFSPDGTLLATASDDQTARICDLASGTTRTLGGGTPRFNHELTTVTFSRDGSLLATASSDRTARIWDVATGTTRTILEGHAGTLWGLAFSPDGTLLATASADKTARIWDVATGTTRTILEGHAGTLWGLAFSPDGTLLATASADKTARIWDVATGTTRTTLEGHTEELNGVAFAPDGDLLATASDDSTVRIWDMATGTTRTIFQDHSARAWNMEFSPDGTLLASASDDGTARIWNLATGENCGTLDHPGNVRHLAFSPDGVLLATACGDGTARIWDISAATPRLSLNAHTGGVNGVAFSPDGTRLATASADNTARIWDLTSGACLVTLIPLTEGGYATLFDGAYKLEGDPDDRLWWAIKLCRFAPGELDPYVPGLRRLPAGEVILPQLS